MAEYHGDVVHNQQGQWRFRETGSTNLQRLSKATIQEPTSVRIEKEITLDQYADTSITVDGDWEHEWIIDATVERQVGDTGKTRIEHSETQKPKIIKARGGNWAVAAFQGTLYATQTEIVNFLSSNQVKDAASAKIATDGNYSYVFYTV
jgi:hypothetical protein